MQIGQANINTSDKKKRERIVAIIGFIIVVVVIIITLNIGGDSEEKEQAVVVDPNNEIGTQSSGSTELDDNSPGFKLAVLESGLVDPPASLVEQFNNQLVILERKCKADNQERIADYIVIGQEKLKEKNINMSFMEIGQAIEGSIPDEADGLLQCAEVAAAFVALRLGG